MLSLSVYEPIAKEILHGGTVPQFGGGVELGGRVWHPAKGIRIRQKFFAGTETLSLSVYEPIENKISMGDRPPVWGGVELGGRV